MVLSHIEVAAAVELDDPAALSLEVAGELLVVDRLGGRDEEDRPSGVGRRFWKSVSSE